MSRNKKLMREYFAVETEYTIKDIEYEIVDEPYLGYKVHLCKLSAGWRPLFQRHKTISTFKEVEKFCLKNKSMVSIYDEYGRRYTWKQYFKKVYNHSQRKAEPRKWIYDIDPIFPDNGARLHMASCTEQEAEIYMPFCHREYNENEKLAKASLDFIQGLGLLSLISRYSSIFKAFSMVLSKRKRPHRTMSLS